MRKARTEGQHHVVAAEAERVVQRRDGARGQGARLVAHDVPVRLRVEAVEVDGRRGQPVVQGQHRGDGLHAARAAEQMAGHRLGGGDRHVVDVVAEDLAQRLELRHIALRGRGRMRVDMRDLGRLELGGVDQVLQRLRDAVAGRLRLGDVVRVGGDALPDGLGVDPRAAPGGVVGRLQDDGARALAHHKTVAGGVERTRGALRVLVVLRHRHHVAEGHDGQRVDGRLGAARDDHIGAAGADHLDGVADGLRARRARADRGVDTGAGADLQADVGRRAVGHQHRHGVRGHLADALLAQHVVLVEEGGHAADAGGHHRAEPVGVDRRVLARLGGETGVRPGLTGRDQRELRRAVELTGVRPRDDGARLHRDTRGDTDRQVGRPVLLEEADAGPPGEQCLPGGSGVATQRRRGTNTGDDHGAIGRTHRISYFTWREGAGPATARVATAPGLRPGA